MRQSQLFTRTRREAPAHEESVNARLLSQAGFVHKEMAGVYSFLPLGHRVLSRIADVVRDEMRTIGGQEVIMPALHPKANWVKTGRWESFDVLFKIRSGASDTAEYGLGPTHEEILFPLMAEYISSYKDLPAAVFQIQAKFRDEKRAKSGILRGREFLMKDLYSFHRSEEDLLAYYARVKESYLRIFERLELSDLLYYTLAPGGTFSAYSHEFQVLCGAGEDTIFLCTSCREAVNEEIKKEETGCPSCGSKDLQKARAAEAGNIFNLGTKFAEAFTLQYRDEQGSLHPVISGCYGIGISRLMGILAEVRSDDRGLRWPKAAAPYPAHVLMLPGGEQEVQRLEKALSREGIEALVDDREDVRAGEKFADADLIGIPYRAVVSAATAERGLVELKERASDETRMVSVESLIDMIRI